jgi:hypothetical protein
MSFLLGELDERGVKLFGIELGAFNRAENAIGQVEVR